MRTDPLTHACTLTQLHPTQPKEKEPTIAEEAAEAMEELGKEVKETVHKAGEVCLHAFELTHVHMARKEKSRMREQFLTCEQPEAVRHTA